MLFKSQQMPYIEFNPSLSPPPPSSTTKEDGGMELCDPCVGGCDICGKVHSFKKKHGRQ